MFQCDLCCSLTVAAHRIGDLCACARCWDRYTQLFRQRVMGAEVRAYIVSQVHRTHCGECARTIPVTWTYANNTKVFEPSVAEPWLAMFCEQIYHD